MKLSVIVVSYNVRGYLSLCIDAALQAMNSLGEGESELIVFDNASHDGSADWVASHFPEVHLIRSEVNLGFSAGNNAAIRASKGEWVLLLNPDTVVPEDTFAKVLAHAETDPRIGAIGVPMYDGSGTWLPESKRGMPTPWASFCRLSGLWRLAPRSQALNGYYFGHVGREETAEVDVLSGAFMWMRRSALDSVGLLDEDFFMYGEDIDLSIRIKQGGWVNHYLSNAPIVHFKGESTKKGSLSYVRVFHGAMRIFSEKHFAGGQAWAMRWMIRLGIQLRAITAFIRGKLGRHALSGLDVLSSILLGVLCVEAHAQITGVPHPLWPTMGMALCAGGATALSSAWFGLGDRPFVRIRSGMAGVAAGLLLVIFYALLPEALRVSRLAVAVTAVALVMLPSVWRSLFVGFRPRSFGWRSSRPEVGLLASQARQMDMENWVQGSYGSNLLVRSLTSLSESQNLDKRLEFVLCDAALGGAAVLNAVRRASESGSDVRVVPKRLWVALGGNRNESAPGALLPWGADGLGRPERMRAKRRLDVMWGVLVLFLGPGKGLFSRLMERRTAWDVIRGRKTWVGFHGGWAGDDRLPELRESVFFAGSGARVTEESEAKRLDLRYAFDFGWMRELELLMTLRTD